MNRVRLAMELLQLGHSFKSATNDMTREPKRACDPWYAAQSARCFDQLGADGTTVRSGS
jgi:hypothetical protein